MIKRILNLLAVLVILLPVYTIHAQTYDQLNMSMYSNWFNPNEPVATGYNIKYNGIWGWHDGKGKEYAIVGAASGTYFIDVTEPHAPVQRDWVQGRRNNCIWREIKTYKNYCYMVSDDGAPNSLQIVDMSYLPDSVHVVYDSNSLFERCHTTYIEGDKLYGGYVHGGSIGAAAMAVFSLADPVNPVLIRNLNADYTLPHATVHDMYVRHDTIYASCGYDGLYIYKLLSNNHFSLLGSLNLYVDQGYNHSNALTDDSHYLVMTDEVPQGLDVKILSVADLSNISVVSHFHTHPDATPHNPFILGDLVYISYYMDGIQVFNISKPEAPFRAGYFDTYWQNPVGIYPSPGYAGSWGAYPWLPSGNLLVSDMQNGLFVLDASRLKDISNVVGNTHFSMLPNPVLKGNDLQIKFKKSDSGSIVEITDMEGRLVYNKTVTGEDLNINTINFSSGMYILRFFANGETDTEKFIVTD